MCTSRLNCSIRHSARIFSALPIIPCLLKRAFVSAWRGGANFYTKNIKPISHNSNKTFNEMNFDSSTLLEKKAVNWRFFDVTSSYFSFSRVFQWFKWFRVLVTSSFRQISGPRGFCLWRQPFAYKLGLIRLPPPLIKVSNSSFEWTEKNSLRKLLLRILISRRK